MIVNTLEQLRGYDIRPAPSLISESRPTPFALNLRTEYNWIRRFGESYKPFFFAEAHYYAKEAIGKVPRVIYEHDIIGDEFSAAVLYIKSLRKTARESYFEPVTDTALPQWFRNRARKDYDVVVELERRLETAKVGDVFIDCSPTEFDIPIEERNKFQYDWHSFVRLYQLKEEGGQKKLIARAIRHYLPREEQAILYAQLTGKRLPGKQLLGNVGKLVAQIPIQDIENDQDIASVQKLISRLDALTPPERRLPSQPNNSASNEEMNRYLKTTNSLLEAVFHRLLSDVRPGETRKEFEAEVVELIHAWEQAIKARVDGNTSSEEDYFLESTTHHEILSNFHSDQPEYATLQHYRLKEYRPAGGDCGSGSGFGSSPEEALSLQVPTRISGKMDHGNLTSRFGENRYPDYHCPSCGTKIQGELKDRPETWIKHCPNANCRQPLNC